LDEKVGYKSIKLTKISLDVAMAKVIARKIEMELDALEKDIDRLLRTGVITPADRKQAMNLLSELYSILLVWALPPGEEY
jgi:uncharacterized protein Yka (UPF0111/DUF47 family)